MTDRRVLLSDLAFPESPRWHDGRVYVSDWGAGEIHACTAAGRAEVVAKGTAFPLCIDFLPDGRLLLVNGSTLLAQGTSGPSTYAHLGALCDLPFNDVTVGPGGHVYVDNIAFEFPGGEPRPGFVAVVSPDGTARRGAGDLMFPNGMTVLGDELVVAESYANRLTAFRIAADGSLGERRTWADLGAGVPDGICADAQGRIWYADVPNQSCTLVAEGGEVVRTIGFDRGAFSCTLGDGVLYVATNAWTGEPSSDRSGQLVAVDLSA